MMNEINRASAIVDHIEMLVHQENYAWIKLDPREIVHSVLTLVGEPFHLANVKIKLILPDTCQQIQCIPNQFERVLLNILINAWYAINSDHAKEYKCIQIKIDTGIDDKIKISIEDSGGGIDETIIDRVFDPFFTTKDVSTSAGLGLFICYRIVHNMDGSITTFNTGQGAKFEIILPVIDSN